jgi:hypothetical protein
LFGGALTIRAEDLKLVINRKLGEAPQANASAQKTEGQRKREMRLKRRAHLDCDPSCSRRNARELRMSSQYRAKILRACFTLKHISHRFSLPPSLIYCSSIPQAADEAQACRLLPKR